MARSGAVAAREMVPAVKTFPARHRNIIGRGGERNFMAIAGEPSERAPRFAIVGYAARLPGSADADQYWGLLHDGRDAV